MVDEIDARPVLAMHLVARACLAVSVAAMAMHLDIAPTELACGVIAAVSLMQSMLNLAGSSALHFQIFTSAESFLLALQMVTANLPHSTDAIPAVVITYVAALLVTWFVSKVVVSNVSVVVNSMYIIFQISNAILMMRYPELRVVARAASVCAFACIVSHRATNFLVGCKWRTLWAAWECVPFAMLAASAIVMDSNLDVATACAVCAFSVPMVFFCCQDNPLPSAQNDLFSVVEISSRRFERQLEFSHPPLTVISDL